MDSYDESGHGENVAADLRDFLGRRAAERGAHSLNRLLLVAEGLGSSIGLSVSDADAAVVASFISDIAGHGAFRFVDLRGMDHDLDQDIMNCIDAIRWGKLSLFESVLNGVSRSFAVCKDWEDELRRRRFYLKVLPERA